jgi:hypothetical protein
MGYAVVGPRGKGRRGSGKLGWGEGGGTWGGHGSGEGGEGEAGQEGATLSIEGGTSDARPVSRSQDSNGNISSPLEIMISWILIQIQIDSIAFGFSATQVLWVKMSLDELG